MPQSVHASEEKLQTLSKTVADAAAFFADADEGLCDGHQTAREVLSHLVFWHREYATIVRALADGQRPKLKKGTYAQLNEAATREFKCRSMPELAMYFLELQDALVDALRCLPDWGVDLSIKHTGRCKSVAERLPAIESHVRNHVRRLQRAERLGEAWVKAYYMEDS